MRKDVTDVALELAGRDGARFDVFPATRGRDRVHPWWRRQLAMLARSGHVPGERLAQHYTAEVRLARSLMEDAESLSRYPHQRVRVLDASDHARRRAQQIQRALEELELPVTEPGTRSREQGHTAWKRLRAHISELSRISEAYLVDAYAAERDHPETAGLLLELHRESAGDRRNLVWTLAQLGETERLSDMVTVDWPGAGRSVEGGNQRGGDRKDETGTGRLGRTRT
jgi:hypothetical protein